MALLSSTISLLIFCLLNLPVCDGRMLKSPGIKWIHLFLLAGSFMLCFRHIYVKDFYIFLKNEPLSHYAMPFLIPDTFFALRFLLP